jgi:hypothetical protein
MNFERDAENKLSVKRL